MRRLARHAAVAISASAALLVGGCAVGPDTGPGFVRGNEGAGGPSSAGPAAPSLQVPKADLDWRDCTAQQAKRAAVTVPGGTTIECATLENSAAPGTTTSDTVDVDVVRLRTATTPKDAAPLVFTTGSDLDSSVAATLLAGSAGSTLLGSHPLVAVDRRGTGPETLVDCMTKSDRNSLLNNGFSGPGNDAARITRLTAAAKSAANGCSDTLSPHQIDFTAKYAAADLEVLRTRWKVDTIGIVGVGDGTSIALAYASQYPKNLGRLVLDTPAPFGLSTKDAAKATAAGTDAAITGFADQCRALNCALGADPKGAVTALLEKARSGGLGPLSDTDVLAAIRLTGGVYTGDRGSAITSTATMLSDAGRGNLTALQTAATRARTVFGTDGQLLTRCNDLAAPIGESEVPGLITAWAAEFPTTGRDAALTAMRCTGWATTESATPKPAKLTLPTLILDGQFDPINGNKGLESVRSTLISAGTPSGSLTWGGLGYSTLIHSSCGAESVVRYLRAGTLPASGACPA